MQAVLAPRRILLRRILAHPLARTYKNVSVDPIQLSSGIVSPQKRIHNNALFQNGNRVHCCGRLSRRLDRPARLTQTPCRIIT